MTDYSELVKALRFETDYVAVEKTMHDAADAIEDLQARLGEAENSVDRWKDMYLTKHEPKRGEWVKNEDIYGWHCSWCKVNNRYAYSWNSETMRNEIQDNYCPNCGAKMIGEQNVE